MKLANVHGSIRKQYLDAINSKKNGMLRNKPLIETRLAHYTRLNTSGRVNDTLSNITRPLVLSTYNR